VLYVSRGKVGPFVASGDALTGGPGRYAVRMALHDEGNGDRLVANTLAIFRPASRL
jgi:hypothetical protein